VEASARIVAGDHTRQSQPAPESRAGRAQGARGAVAAFGLGAHAAGDVLFALMTVAAALESPLVLCIGCELFALLMRAGVAPERVPGECADITAHLGRARS